MQQFQMENDRLLSEFRAQKKENELLKADRNKLLQQQAETEKLRRETPIPTERAKRIGQ